MPPGGGNKRFVRPTRSVVAAGNNPCTRRPWPERTELLRPRREGTRLRFDERHAGRSRKSPVIALIHNWLCCSHPPCVDQTSSHRHSRPFPRPVVQGRLPPFHPLQPP